jgi:hypothetical protein
MGFLLIIMLNVIFNLTLGDAITASPNLSMQHDDLEANLRSSAIV